MLKIHSRGKEIPPFLMVEELLVVLSVLSNVGKRGKTIYPSDDDIRRYNKSLKPPES